MLLFLHSTTKWLYWIGLSVLNRFYVESNRFGCSAMTADNILETILSAHERYFERLFDEIEYTIEDKCHHAVNLELKISLRYEDPLY